jgi:hypothetical protein
MFLKIPDDRRHPMTGNVEREAFVQTAEAAAIPSRYNPAVVLHWEVVKCIHIKYNATT